MSGWREVPYTPNRRVIHDLLSRARRYHCPVTGSGEVDVTDSLAAVRALRVDGRKISFVAYLVRATALCVAAHPSLQRHLFTTWWGRRREVAFDRIHCTLIVRRTGDDGEEILLPALLRDVDRLSIGEIQAAIDHHRSAPLAELDVWRALQRVKTAPGWALAWFDYQARSNPDFYLRTFGTYGLSSVIDPEGPGNALSTVANTAVAFLPSTLKDRPWVVDGRVEVRRILNFSAVFDHYLVDGAEMLRVSHTLSRLLERPGRVLGDPPGSSPPSPG